MNHGANVRWIPSEAVKTASEPPRVSKRETVSGIPSRFAQLVALASLGRDEMKQRGSIGQEAAEAWREAFLRWLCMNLAEQKRDLDAFAAWLGVSVGETLTQWYSSELDLLIPKDASVPERLLFLGDVRTLFELAGGRRRNRRKKARDSGAQPEIPRIW